MPQRLDPQGRRSFEKVIFIARVLQQSSHLITQFELAGADALDIVDALFGPLIQRLGKDELDVEPRRRIHFGAPP